MERLAFAVGSHAVAVQTPAGIEAAGQVFDVLACDLFAVLAAAVIDLAAAKNRHEGRMESDTVKGECGQRLVNIAGDGGEIVNAGECRAETCEDGATLGNIGGPGMAGALTLA